MSLGEISEALDVDLKNGLTKAQTSQRVKKYGKNTVYSVKKGDDKPYVLRAVSNLSVLLLSLVAIIHAVILHEYEMLVIPVLLGISMLIVFYAYSKSRLVLEENTLQSIPRTRVIRDGKLMIISQDRIVPGDVFVFSAGDIIPCDARLIESTDLHVLEKSLGSDVAPIKKNAEFRSSNTIPYDQRINMVYATGVVLKGRGRAVAVATGKSTYMSMKGESIYINSEESIKVLDSFEKYSTYLSLFMCLFVILFTVGAILFKFKLGIYNSFALTLTLYVASMCEFLPIFAKIIISCGIFGAGKRRKNINSGVMIKNSGKLENIKDIDCLVFHKESLYAQSDIGIEPCFFGEESEQNEELFNQTLKKVIIAKGIYGASRINSSNEKNESIYSPEDEKLISKAKERSIYNKRLDEEYPAIEHKRQVFKGINYETTVVRAESTNVFYAVCVSSSILKLCEYERVGNELRVLDNSRRREIENQLLLKLRGGSKVICVATREYKAEKNVYHSPNTLFSSMVFEGAITVTRPVISGAIEYIKLCNQAGIKTVMICDDVSEANTMLAKNIGIISSHSEVVSVSELSEMSGEMVRTNIPIYKVYQGLNVPQLKFIISYIRSDCKKTVAYLGRELSHLSLINESDVGFAEIFTVSERAAKKGIAVSKSNLPDGEQGSKDSERGGCEALKFSADVILSKPDPQGNGGFNSAVLSIIAAKGIWRNLYLICQYMALMFFSRTVLVLFSIISGVWLITPIQLLFMGVVCDLFAMVMIAFEKPEKAILKSKAGVLGQKVNGVKEGFLSFDLIKHTLVYSSVAALGTLVSIVALFLMGKAAPENVSNVTTITFIGSIIFQIALIAEIVNTQSIFKSKIKVYNIYPIYLIIMAALIISGMVIAPIGAILDIGYLSSWEWVAVFVPAILIIVTFEVFKYIFRKKM